jgi:hypothetical protein
MKTQVPKSNDETIVVIVVPGFELGIWKLSRHSCFDIRHFSISRSNPIAQDVGGGIGIFSDDFNQLIAQ